MSQLKYLLTRIGERLPQSAIAGLIGAVNYLEAGRWLKAHGYDTDLRVDRRERLYDRIGREVGDQKILYLEFGVFQGASMHYICKLLTHPDTRLEGYDSFEGLPEVWMPDRPKGHFDVGGAIPQIDDPRVSFFKGWFQDTLPSRSFPPHDVLVVNFDADLYSSTVYVLDQLKSMIAPGTYLYFDEFNHMHHEMKAFDEFIEETCWTFEFLGATRNLQHALFKRTA